LQAIIESFCVADKQAGVIAKARVGDAESRTGKVICHFMVIDCRQDGRRTAQGGKGIGPKAPR
jgi:hypothetical protein